MYVKEILYLCIALKQVYLKVTAFILHYKRN